MHIPNRKSNVICRRERVVAESTVKEGEGGSIRGPLIGQLFLWQQRRQNWSSAWACLCASVCVCESMEMRKSVPYAFQVKGCVDPLFRHGAGP